MPLLVRTRGELMSAESFLATNAQKQCPMKRVLFRLNLMSHLGTGKTTQKQEVRAPPHSADCMPFHNTTGSSYTRADIPWTLLW
jgi:hypothetical protein